jgi:type IV pilus assembly protein PilA
VRAVEDDRSADTQWLEIGIGPKRTGYYLAKFARFAAGEGYVSWNWPAFFVTTPWLLYRKMWAYAALYFLGLPVGFLLLPIVAAAWDLEGLALPLIWGFQLVVAFVAVPLFANALYYRVVRKRIVAATAGSSDHDRQLRVLAEKGGTTQIAVLAILAAMFAPFGEILTSMAIQAYQDYTIRAQVSEGLSAAAGARAAVTDAIVRTGVVPADNAEAGIRTEISGRYVESVQIDLGRIDVTYGAAANPALAGKTLSLTPYRADPQSGSPVLWRCGGAEVPAAATDEIAVYRATDIEPRYLPSACISEKDQGIASSSSSRG